MKLITRRAAKESLAEFSRYSEQPGFSLRVIRDSVSKDRRIKWRKLAPVKLEEAYQAILDLSAPGLYLVQLISPSRFVRASVRVELVEDNHVEEQQQRS